MSKTVLITGATSGIGYEFCRIFAERRFNLVAVSRSRDKLEALADQLGRLHNVQVTVIEKDLSSPAAPYEIYDEMSAGRIAVDVLVNNAGAGISGRVVDLGAAGQQQLIGLNILAPTLLCRLFGTDMARRGSGGILNVASTAAFQAGPFMSVYYASKAYLLSFSEGLGAELKSSGVTVTTLCPGPTRTDFFNRAGMKGSKLDRSPFMMSPARVAEIGFSALENGKAVVIPGIVNKLLAFSVRVAPRRVITAVTAYLNHG